MLLKIDKENELAERVRGSTLKKFGIDERKFQSILFNSLDNLIPDDELLLIMESRSWQEEPDLMAIDKDGRLYIFELKAWESKSENILQVLRYGQIFGNHTYEDLNRIYKKRKKRNDEKNLSEYHYITFGVRLPTQEFNKKQVFVVMTNGIDYKTREAINYWRTQSLDIRPWIYRVYGKNEMQIEMSTFTSIDNPYEDISEGYQILNTNIRNNQKDHDSMLSEKIAAAYFHPWKLKIKNLSKGDNVFLYQSGKGIVAIGKASGSPKIRDYNGNSKHPDEEYYMKLNQFHKLEKPLSAAEIKDITGVNHRFMSTMFSIDAESGQKLYKEALSRKMA